MKSFTLNPTVRAYWALMGIVGLAAWLRFYSIVSEPLWLDEAMSLHYANQSLIDFLKAHHRPHAYYFLLHFWTLFGESEFVLRSLSAVIGVLTIPLIFGLGKTTNNARVGLTASLLLAISPFHIQYAQEARGYTLLVFGATLAMWAITWLLSNVQIASIPFHRLFWKRSVLPDTPPSDILHARAAWLAFIAGVVTSLYTHDTFFLFLVAANIAFGICYPFKRYSWRGLAKNWALATLVILLLWSISWPALFQASAKIMRGFWIAFMPMGKMLGHLPHVFFFADHATLGKLWEVVINYIFFGLSLLGLSTWVDKKWAVVFGIAFIFTAPLGEYLVGYFFSPIYLDRTIIWTSIPFIVMVAAGLSKLKNPALLSVLLCVILAGYTWADIRYYNRTRKPDWRSTAQVITEQVRKDDLLVLIPYLVNRPFLYHIDNYDHDDQNIDQQTHYVNHRKKNIIEKLQPRIRDADRIWVIVWNVFKKYQIIKRDVLSFLKIGYSIIDQHHPHKLETILLGPDQANWESTAKYMAQRISPEDLIVLNPGFADFFLMDYLRKSGIGNTVHRVAHQSTDFIKSLQNETKDRQRTWLVSVSADASFTKSKARVIRFLQKKHTLIAEHHPYKIDLYLYENK